MTDQDTPQPLSSTAPADVSSGASAEPTAQTNFQGSASKVMDVSSPGEAMPSPTKRPVIITNRSMVNADPIIARQRQNPVVPAEPAPEPQPSEPASNTLPPANQSEPEQPQTEGESPDVTASVAEAHKEKVLTPPVGNVTSEQEKPQATDQQDLAEPAAISSNDEALEELKQKYRGETVPDTDLEVAAREAELLAVAEKGTYKLPLHQGHGHTEKLLIICFVIGIALLLVVNILMDLDIIDVSGMPHTNFL